MDIQELLKRVSRSGEISDLHLTRDWVPTVRVDGQLRPYLEKPLTEEDLQKIKGDLLNKSQIRELEETGELDCSYSIAGVCRFRVHAYYQKNTLAFALRAIPHQIMELEALGLPEVVLDLSREERGLILFTGATGSGKTTTLSAVLDFINRERCCHIITLEDPIEYLYQQRKSLVHQREVGTDTVKLAPAITRTLRQDPDIILVGEMRDLESMAMTLEAAETGHLVLSSLHSPNAPQSIQRILDTFPSDAQKQIQLQLSGILKAVVAQRLIPRKGGGRVAAFEVLLVNAAVSNLIREGKIFQIRSLMQLPSCAGMQTLDSHLIRLLKEDVITRETALRWSQDGEELKQILQKEGFGEEFGEENRGSHLPPDLWYQKNSNSRSYAFP